MQFSVFVNPIFHKQKTETYDASTVTPRAIPRRRNRETRRNKLRGCDEAERASHAMLVYEITETYQRQSRTESAETFSPYHHPIHTGGVCCFRVVTLMVLLPMMLYALAQGMLLLSRLTRLWVANDRFDIVFVERGPL